MGGKRRLAKQIIPLFGKHTTYVEPFCGGAALFFNKEEAKVEVLNDMNGELVNLYRIVQHHLEAFLQCFKWALISREGFSLHKQTDPKTLTDIQRAARFYYLQKMAFGSKMTNPSFGVSVAAPPKLNLLRMEEDLSAGHLRLARVYIEQLDWQKCTHKYDRPETLFYLDPPYWGTAGYGNEFGLDQYDQMADLARSIKGKMIISVNDIPEMRKAFAGLHMKQVRLNHTVGGGGGKKAEELIIWNDKVNVAIWHIAYPKHP